MSSHTGFTQDWLVKKKKQLEFIVLGDTGKAKRMSQLYTYAISISKTKLFYKCLNNFFMHQPAMQHQSWQKSSFHLCPVLTDFKFLLVLLSMKLDIYNKWNYYLFFFPQHGDKAFCLVSQWCAGYDRKHISFSFVLLWSFQLTL